MGKKASVHWTGAGPAGKGEISTETGQLDKVPYGFATRFGSRGIAGMRIAPLHHVVVLHAQNRELVEIVLLQ